MLVLEAEALNSVFSISYDRSTGEFVKGKGFLEVGTRPLDALAIF